MDDKEESSPQLSYRDKEAIDKLLQDDYDLSEEEGRTASPETIEKYDFTKLPPHACDYCGIFNPDCVVRCCEKGCGKWFCNSKAQGLASHIVLHLVSIFWSSFTTLKRTSDGR
jgi:hypothetical protein